jgi:hypothetical protein
VAALCAICQPTAVLRAAAPEAGAGAAPERPLFYISREEVPGGAELLTVLGRVDAGSPPEEATAGDVPLVSVLRDTLGDDDPGNDRLRYVWVHGYTSPSVTQRVASAVPFLNQRTGNRGVPSEDATPPSLIDLAAPARDVWDNAMWIAAQSLLFDPYGMLAKTSVRAFRRNRDDYRKAHVIRALAVLSLYEAETGADPVLTPLEMRDIQARLMLAQRSFGGIIDDSYLQRAYERESASSLDTRGHNWELLRQRVEAEGLYFDPLAMPDGSATHALVWVRRDEVASARPFNKRFLNITRPWGDARLLAWKGYVETRYVDEAGREVPRDTPGARAVEMIPLALYGLDHPKIPVLLVDFRDHGNPKRREVSRRVLNDITRNILSLSPYGDLHYFVGQTVYNFVTGRRGMDINQPSRLRSYSQLKLLLSLSASLDPALAAETERLVERVSMNPLQNDRDIEIELAYQSYAALRDAARAPGGALARKLERDRRAEFARLEHGRTARVMLTTAAVLSAGLYRHREPDAPADQRARIDTARRLAYHTRFLEEVVASTPRIEVSWNLDDVRRSLAFLAEHGHRAPRAAADAAARVFASTQDPETQRLSVRALSRFDSGAARRALETIVRSADVDPQLRALAAGAGPVPDRPGPSSGTVLASATGEQ